MLIRNNAIEPEHVEVPLVLPRALLALYRELAEDSGVILQEALVQGLRFAIRSRRTRPPGHPTKPARLERGPSCSSTGPQA